MINFAEQVVVITGAANGQGRVEAEMFAELGARVVVADIDGRAARAVADAIGGRRAVALELDVAELESWKSMLDGAVGEFGGVDALVNNAGIFVPGSFLTSSPEDFSRQIAVNQMGTYYGMTVVGAHMVSQGGGAIVNVASISGVTPNEGSTLYGATKAAVINLTKGAALEWGPFNVRVNAVLPGGVDTRLLRSDRRSFFDTLPLGRLARPDEIARAVIFFASDASSYCTGEALVVDGGWSLGTSEATLTGRTGIERP